MNARRWTRALSVSSLSAMLATLGGCYEPPSFLNENQPGDGDGDGDGDGSVDESFVMRVDPDHCEILANSIVFYDPDSGLPYDDVPHYWTSCWFDWSGDWSTDTHYVTLLLLAPGTWGNIVYPGPRWLSVGLPASTDFQTTMPVLAFPSANADSSTYAHGVYVDTDSQAEAETPDANSNGAYWADASGEATISAIDGDVTPDPTAGWGEDPGDATFTMYVSDIELKLLDGRVVNVEGEITVTGEIGGGGGGNVGWGSCPSLTGEACVAMNFDEADNPSQAQIDFAASCADSNDGDTGAYQDGKCSMSGAVAQCTDAQGTLETTQELVPIEVVWYPAACGLNLSGTCSSLGGSFSDLGGC